MGCTETTLTYNSNTITEDLGDRENFDKLAEVLCRCNKQLGKAYTEVRNTGDYTKLLTFLEDESMLFGIRAFPKWAEPPGTAACVAVLLLNKQLNNQKTQLLDEEVLLKYVPVIKEAFVSRDPSLVQHLIYFIWKAIRIGYSRFMSELLSVNIFSVINKLLVDKNYLCRFTTAKLCNTLYQRNDEAKELFCNSMGVRYLCAQIYLSPLEGFHFCQRLKFLMDIMTNERGIDDKFAVIVIEEVGPTFLSSLDIRKLSETDSEVVYQLITILLYARKKVNQ